MNKEEFKTYIDRCIMNRDLPTNEDFYSKLDSVFTEILEPAKGFPPEVTLWEYCKELFAMNASITEAKPDILKAMQAYHAQFTTATLSVISQIEGLKHDNISVEVNSRDERIAMYQHNRTIDEVLSILRQSPPVIQAKCKWIITIGNPKTALVECKDQFRKIDVDDTHCRFCGKKIERGTK